MNLLSKFIIVLVTFLFSENLQAYNYYSRTNGNWNAPSVWSTVAHTSTINSGTFPQAGDSVFIGDGHTISIAANAACSYLSIGQGTNGTLVFSNTSNRTFTLAGDLFVNSGALFTYNQNSNRNHTINIGGSIINNGSIDFYFDPNDVVNINFNGSNSLISGNGNWDLNNCTLNLNTPSNTFDVQSISFENAIRGSLNLLRGTYLHSNSSTFDCNSFMNATITSNVTVEIRSGAMNFATNANYLFLQGTLKVAGGNCTIGKASGAEGIATDQNGTNVPFLEITSGTLDINGGITNRINSASDPFHFKMNGGKLLLQTSTNPSALESFKVTDVTGSIFEMYGGEIIIEQPNTSSSNNLPDLNICGTNGAVYSTGGLVQFGNSKTISNAKFSFKPYANAIYPNFKINNGELSPSANSGNTAHFKLLSLQIDTLCRFDNRSIRGSRGDSKDMYLCGSISGYAFNNNGTFLERKGSVIFKDDSIQHLGGSTATNFENFEIDNPFELMIDTSISVSGILTLTNGIINTTINNLITFDRNSTVPLGSQNSFISGPMRKEIASNGNSLLNFPIGASGFYRPAELRVNHNSNNQVYYWGRVTNSPASNLPYSLPVSFANVSTTRYWQFVRTGSNNFTNGTTKLYYGADDGVGDANNLRIGQNSSIAWIDEGGTGTTPISGSIISNVYSIFNGIFTLANSTGGSNSLPVTLTTFEAKWTKDGSQLKWATASEINNNYFEVMRSFDGVNYNIIGRLSGSGNSTQLIEYSYLDKLATNKLLYYKLKQTDYDGNYTFSDVRTVRASANFDMNSIKLYPTVSNGQNIWLSLQSQKFPKLILSIIDDQGKIYQKQNIFPNQQIMKLNNTSNLEKGKYFAVIESQAGKKVIPFFINY